MKAKTTKFLAVLAVLAMAFAGVAVLAQEQINDADEVAATTAATYDKDVISEAGISKIKLEETAGAKSVVLYKAAIKDDKGKVVTPATEIKANNAYYFNTDAKVTLPNTQWNSGVFVFFVLNEVEVELVPPTEVDAWSHTVGTLWVNVASEADGVITLSEAKAGDNAFGVNGYFGRTMSAEAWNVDTEATVVPEWDSISGVDSKLALGNDKSAKMTADDRDSDKFLYNTPVLNVRSDCTVYGGDALSIVNYTADKIAITFENYTGTIVYNKNSMKVKDFTGVVESVAKMKVPVGAGTADVLKVNSIEGGLIVETSETTLLNFVKDVTLNFAEGAKVGGAFGYIDEFGDWHAVSGANAESEPMIVGINGLAIYADENMIGLQGTVTLDAATTLITMGNVVISGMIYTTAANTLTLENTQADIKLAGLQIAGSGKVTLGSSVLVTAGTSFLVKGDLALSDGAVLKVAEGSIVKVEGALTMIESKEATTEPAQEAVVGSAIWNAGQVIVPGYSNGAYDKQLIRVYMNSTAGTGKFFAGSVEYDGTALNAPLAVAYGAYLDVTGKCSVNLTSGGITVVNNLYKYKTMILATKNTTIPLTVDYDNQYPAEFNLRGKDYSGPVTTAQSAVYRNVVWETPNVATIYVTAPEVYTVTLVKTYDGDAIESVWTDGLVVKDLQGRIIPISGPKTPDTYTAGDGEVKLVFGEKYTITGAIEENDYSFVDVKEVITTLKKVSQTQGSFTMIRNLETKVDDNSKTVEAPAEIQVEMGKATVVTVSLTDAEKRIAAGDVVLSYSVDDGKTYKDVVKPAAAADPITFSIFSNQTVLLKYPAVEFFKFSAKLDVGESPTEASVPYNVINTTADLTDKQKKAGWINAFEIDSDEAESVKATIGLTCALDVMVQTFTFDKTKTAATAATLTITFEEGKYYTKGAHKAVETINFNSAATPAVISHDITMYKGEVFSMTWTDVPDAREKMTYVSGPEYDITIADVAAEMGTVEADKTTARAGEIVTLTITLEEGKVLTGLTINGKDLRNTSFVMPADDVEIVATIEAGDTGITITETVPTATSTEYVSGTAFTVDKENAFTLAVDDIEYVNVLNSTNTEAVITDNDIAKDGVPLEAQKLKEKAIEQINENLVKLSVEGSYVISWSYKLTVVEGTGANAKTGYVSGTVSGASALFNFQHVQCPVTGGDPITDGVVTTMEITTINSERIVYWVQINQDENLRYDKYSAGGYMDDVMKVWATPATGFKITKIDVYYWTQESGKGDWYAEAVMEESPGETGTTVWTYTMPASDVLLVPDVDSNYATITYKNYDGTVLQETPQPKGVLPVYSGETPVKPATATETYEFAGWDPRPVIVTEDATYVAQFNTVEPTSTNVTVAIGQTGADVNFIVYSNDQYAVGSGVIKYKINYVYYDEEFDMEMLGVYEGEKTYTATEDAATFIKLVVDDIAEQLGDYYLGVYSVTGEYQFGEAEGNLNKTVYNPVEA